MATKDKEVKDLVPVLQKETAPMVKKARELAITNEASATEGAAMLTQLKVSLKRITTEKEKITKPLKEVIKVENARWATLEDNHEQAIDTLRKNLGTYQTEASRIADAKAAKIAERVGEGKGHLKVETAMSQIDAIDKPSTTLAGSVGFMTVKKFEILDLALVPLEYHVADESKIRAAMREGVELAGVRYYSEKVAKVG